MWIFSISSTFSDHCMGSWAMWWLVAVSFLLHHASGYTESYVMEDRCGHLVDLQEQQLAALRLRLTSARQYRPHISCELALRAPPRRRLVIVIQWMDIAGGRFNSCADFLAVMDGEPHNKTGPVPGLKPKLCGHVSPPPVTSSGRAVTLKFDSTTFDHGSGFSIVFTVYHSGPCHQHELECGNGRCIDKRLKCDDDNNCGDNSDDCKLTAVDVVIAVLVTAIVFLVIISLACLWCHRDRIRLRFKRKCPTIGANPDGVYQPTTFPLKDKGNSSRELTTSL